MAQIIKILTGKNLQKSVYPYSLRSIIIKKT